MDTETYSNKICFSESGEFFYVLCEDGKVKVWNTATGTFKQEYTKNLHLSSSYSCCVSFRLSETKKQKANKRQKTILHSKIQGAELLALGTCSGDIQLFNVSTNNVISSLKEHSARINHLSWTNETLYSCSDDKYIIHWDVKEQKIESKWKAGNEKIKCILVLADENKLISSSCTIKLWDLVTKQMLKKFVGHATEIISLSEVPAGNSYFISAATGDRIINIWSWKSEGENNTPVASLQLQDSCFSVHVTNKGGNTLTTVMAITSMGILHIFKHQLNGYIAKPVKPLITVTVVSSTGENKDETAIIPILAALPDHNNNVAIVYGCQPHLTFEIITLTEHDKNIVLVRDARKTYKVAAFDNKIRVPEINNDVEYQVQGNVALKRNRQKELDIPLQKRLENLTLVQPGTSGPPKVDNMSQLLIQGLQSKDKSILHNVLFRNDESIINTTVKNLPIQAIIPFIRELTALMQGKTFTSKVAVRWLRAVVCIHTGILIVNRDISELFAPLLACSETRLSMLAPLLRLRGRLNLVSEQIGNNIEREDTDLIEPLLTYHERDSSDENSEIDMDALNSESDQWDELSLEEDDDDDEMDDQDNVQEPT